MSSCSAAADGPGPGCAPPGSRLAQMGSALEAAAEQMMVLTDFQAAFDTCNRALESLASLEGLDPLEQDDSRCWEYKAGFCTLGIQALAELNQWRAALPWVLRQYEDEEKIPPKILQLCILLYSKVGEPEVVRDTARVWLLCPSNRGAWGFRTVAELYLLHVLAPLRRRDEAERLVLGEIGSSVFTEDQRRTALELLEEKEQQDGEPPETPSQESPGAAASTRGPVLWRLEAALKLLYRRLLLLGSRPLSLRRLLLAAALLYMLLLRSDPALPSSFAWISKLFQLLKQMWTAMFAPYHQAASQSNGL